MDANKELAQRLAEDKKQLAEELATCQAALKAAEAKIQSYAEAGTPEEVSASMKKIKESDSEKEKMSDTLNTVKELAGAEDEEEAVAKISESMSQLATVNQSLIQFNEEFGTLEEAGAAINEGLAAATTLKEITEALGATTPADIIKLAKEFGTIAQISESIDKATEALSAVAEEKAEGEIAAIAKMYGKTPEMIKEAMEKFKLADASAVKDFYETAGVSPVESDDDEDDEMSESYVPGSALNGMLTGKAFVKATRDISESDLSKNIAKQNDISESTNSAERFARMVS